MKEFYVEITEIFQKTVKVEAEDGDNALLRARERYDRGEYSVKPSEIVAAEFDIKPKWAARSALSEKSYGLSA